MKMRTLFLLGLFCLFAICSAFAADSLPVPAAAAAAQTPSILTWAMANSAAIFGVALAISEFLALIPGFHGNGILDAIIKALSTLSKKPE
ncbi:MAG: hypothetical protein PHC49_18430 [Desulfuromonadaceae bacterium]|nr:hypothetical protein [Desulfuromonadaceae bacterium]